MLIIADTKYDKAPLEAARIGTVSIVRYEDAGGHGAQREKLINAQSIARTQARGFASGTPLTVVALRVPPWLSHCSTSL